MLRSVAASYRAVGREVCVLALSAAAARVVTEETGIPATTIASWQHRTAALPLPGSCSSTRPLWCRRSR